jgi:hypothetical protein
MAENTIVRHEDRSSIWLGIPPEIEPESDMCAAAA